MAQNNSRLISAAKLLEKGLAVADIGTDHALLPIYLIKNNIAESVIACDIAEGPLEVAKSNVARCKMEDKISLRLAKGLDKVKSSECQAVTIMGMGGETISKILSDAPWLKNGGQTLILQPMTADDRLREFLVNEGYRIYTEKGVYSKGRVYTIIKAKYYGKPQTLGEDFYYIGMLLEGDTVGKEEIDYVLKRLKSLKKCLESINGVERRKNLYERISVAVPLIEEKLKKLKVTV